MNFLQCITRRQIAMQLNFLLLAFLLGVPHVRAGDKPLPVIKVSTDGFPAGHEAPEGVAADLARAFIRRDVKLFDDTCIKKPLSANKKYSAFLKETARSIREQARRKEPAGPEKILKVFAARSLSHEGPASYGYAMFGFEDVKFVDVLTLLYNGEKYLNRTLVIKDKTGKWYVYPQPESSPLLSFGLNEESDSRINFSDAYRVQK